MTNQEAMEKAKEEAWENLKSEGSEQWEACPFEMFRAGWQAATKHQDALIAEWRNAALVVGESLSSVGPDNYYNFTPEQWRLWALSVINDKSELRELCLQVAGAVFAFAAPSREMESIELIAIVDKVLGEQT